MFAYVFIFKVAQLKTAHDRLDAALEDAEASAAEAAAVAYAEQQYAAALRVQAMHKPASAPLKGPVWGGHCYNRSKPVRERGLKQMRQNYLGPLHP